MLLPALAPAGRGYVIDVVEQALLACAFGPEPSHNRHRPGRAGDTVRGWIRRVRARAEWLRVQGTIAAHNFDPMLPAIVPAGSLLLANAVSALGTAAAALARRIGLLAPPWQIIAMIACGQFLALAQRRPAHTQRRSYVPKTATA